MIDIIFAIYNLSSMIDSQPTIIDGHLTGRNHFRSRFLKKILVES
jgi:hypothetical protein